MLAIAGVREALKYSLSNTGVSKKHFFPVGMCWQVELLNVLVRLLGVCWPYLLVHI